MLRLLDFLGVKSYLLSSKKKFATCFRRCLKTRSTVVSLVGLLGQRLIVVSEMPLRSTVTSLRPR